jgi:hypothetical protein
VIEEETLDLI